MIYSVRKKRKRKLNFNRHQLRQIAFQSIFIQFFNEDLSCEDAITHALDLFESAEDEEYEFVLPEYVVTTVNGVKEHQSELDALISKHLNKWKLERIAKTDLAILRLTTYEMLYQSDIPNKVALNEALELAKEFSDDESRRFVNGVLSSILTSLEDQA